MVVPVPHRSPVPGHPPDPAPCVWRGEWGSVHSLAVVNDGLAAALSAIGADVHRIGRDDPPAASAAVGVAAHWPPSFEAPSEGPFVLYQPWEMGAVPAAWIDPIRRLVDEVWTPSAYARRAFVDSGVAPELVHVVPNGVDLDRFTPEGPALELPVAAATTLLFVGGTIHRKGIDLLLRAYAGAFTEHDDVVLVVKAFGGRTHYAGQTPDGVFERFRAVPGAPRLVVLDDEVPFEDMPALYRSCDVLVQPYRGEGFCLPALEALACGRPVVVTAGGPTDEFTSDACAWRIPAGRSVVPADAIAGWELARDGSLLEPDVDALTRILRETADPGARAARARNARGQAEVLGWPAAAALAAARLAALDGRQPVRRAKVADVPGRRRTLFAVAADWDDRATWAPALHAYASAFAPGDETTLVLPAPDERAALALVEAEIAAGSLDPGSLADVILGSTAGLEPVALELAADAYICAEGRPRPGRARRIVPPDPAALRAVATR